MDMQQAVSTTLPKNFRQYADVFCPMFKNNETFLEILFRGMYLWARRMQFRRTCLKNLLVCW